MSSGFLTYLTVTGRENIQTIFQTKNQSKTRANRHLWLKPQFLGPEKTPLNADFSFQHHHNSHHNGAAVFFWLWCPVHRARGAHVRSGSPQYNVQDAGSCFSSMRITIVYSSVPTIKPTPIAEASGLKIEPLYLAVSAQAAASAPTPAQSAASSPGLLAEHRALSPCRASPDSSYPRASRARHQRRWSPGFIQSSPACSRAPWVCPYCLFRARVARPSIQFGEESISPTEEIATSGSPSAGGRTDQRSRP